MSTRAIIKVVNGDKEKFIYHHCDGYPSGVGYDLKRYLNIYKGDWNINPIVYDLCELYLIDTSYERVDGQAGDEEYAYIIDCDNRTLTCYKIGWDEFDWKEDKIEFCHQFKKEVSVPDSITSFKDVLSKYDGESYESYAAKEDMSNAFDTGYNNAVVHASRLVEEIFSKFTNPELGAKITEEFKHKLIEKKYE